MKQKLPQQTEILALFPKNLRFFTEYTFSESQSHYIKVVVVSVVSLFLLSLITLQGITIWANLLLQISFTQERSQLQNEVTYWENIANKYKGYRDVDYRIAALQYKLGNISESQKYVKKALQLDPNYQDAKDLDAELRRRGY